MSNRFKISALILFASILLLAIAAPATEAPAEPLDTMLVEQVSVDNTDVWPLTPSWMSTDLQLASNNRCVPPTCLIDFLCFDACENGPDHEFCSCIQSCIVFCA